MRKELGMGLLGAVVAISLFAGPTMAASTKKPTAEDVATINDARGDVHHAIIELYHANHDFRGHRVKAIAHLKRARHQLALCAAVDDKAEEAEEDAASKTAPGKAIDPKVKNAGSEPHPMIDAAIRSLDRAIVDLKDAHHVYHGHRADALKQTREAKEQLEVCLKVDKN